MHSEFVFLRQYFSNNGYPLGTVNSNIKKFLAKHFENNSEQIERNSLDQVSFFSLPFFGRKSGQMKIELNLLLVKYFPYIAFKIIVFVNYLKIGSFFHFKDRLPLASRLSVVYQFECPLCGDPYVGSTSLPSNAPNTREGVTELVDGSKMSLSLILDLIPIFLS